MGDSRKVDASAVLMQDGHDSLQAILDAAARSAADANAKARGSGKPKRKKSLPNENRDEQDVELPLASEAWNAFAKPPVPTFPLEALPQTLSGYAQERATASGADVSAFAMASLAILSGVVDHRVRLKPKRFHDDLLIPPVLWTLLVAPPSSRKTAIMSAAHKAIDRLDGRDLEAYLAARDAEEMLAKAEDRDPETIPQPRHRVITDATSERVCDLLSRQDCGAILIRDELSGWIGAMDKYGGGGKGAAQDRSIWTRAFDGGPYTQERVGGDRRVRNLSVSVIGSIQPDRLREMGNLDSDGLLQRFLPVVMGEAQPYRDEERDLSVERAFTELIDSLDKVQPGTYLLANEGRKRFEAFDADMIKAGRTTEPSPAFGAFLAKLPRTLGAIALILHLVDVIEGRALHIEDVSDQALANAEKIVREFIIPHGEIFYDLQSGGRALNRARQIATAIIKHKDPVITLRDLTRATRAMGDDREDALKRLYPFEAGGWLTPVERGPYNTSWYVTPGLSERFAAEHEAEMRLHAEIRERINRRKGVRS